MALCSAICVPGVISSVCCHTAGHMESQLQSIFEEVVVSHWAKAESGLIHLIKLCTAKQHFHNSRLGEKFSPRVQVLREPHNTSVHAPGHPGF